MAKICLASCKTIASLLWCDYEMNLFFRHKASVRRILRLSLLLVKLHATAKLIEGDSFGGMIFYRARVVEWQTRRTQNPLASRLWGFNSLLGHQSPIL
jgi:hypothetical protein